MFVLLNKICNVKDFKEENSVKRIEKAANALQAESCLYHYNNSVEELYGKKKSSVQIIRHSFHDILTAMLVLIKISRRTAHCRWHFIMRSLKSSHSLPQRERSLMRAIGHLVQPVKAA